MTERLESRIFLNRSIHYPKGTDDYQHVMNLVMAQGGTFVQEPSVAHIKLVPSRRVGDYPPGDYTDISYLHDCIAAGKLLDEDRYTVGEHNAVPLAEMQRIASEKVRTRVRAQASPPRARIVEERTAATPPVPQAPERTPPHAPGAWGPRPGPPPPRTEPIPRSAHPAIYRKAFFTPNDEMRLIEYVALNEKRTKGKSSLGQNLWKQAAAEGLCGGIRSWQSLEGKWKKTIRPQLQYFYLAEYEAWVSAGKPEDWRPVRPADAFGTNHH